MTRFESALYTRSLMRYPQKTATLILVWLLVGIVISCRTDSQAPSSDSDSSQDYGADLLIVGGTVLAMDAEFSIYDPGYVAVLGDRIASIGPAAESSAIRARRRVDADGRYVMPGLINGHQHAAMSVMRGMADDLKLMQWLERYIFPAEAKNVDPDFVYWGTLLSCIEMIRSGTTTYVDMYYFEDKVAEATASAGMRGVLGQTVLDFPSPDFPDSETAIARTAEGFLRKWKGHPLIVPAIAPHAPYTCSEKTLMAAKQAAEEADSPIIIHLAETRNEVQQIQERSGTTPIRYLDRIGFLSPRVIAAHVVWADDEEIEILRAAGVGVVHNPESNMKLASGVAPIQKMLEAGLKVGIGTDGPASNNNLDLLQEVDFMAKLQKLATEDPTVLDARTALAIATIGGAKAIGMEERLGSLEPGKQADLILISKKRPESVPSYDPYSTIVYSLTGSSVEMTVVNGEIVFESGTLTKIDEAEVMEKIRFLQEQVKKTLSKDTPETESDPPE